MSTKPLSLIGQYWLPVAAYAGLIAWVSHQPQLPGPTRWLLEVLGDKPLHAIEYSLLGGLCYRAFRQASGRRASRVALGLAVLASAGYGATDELHQAFVPGREPSSWDILADTLGAALGARAWHGWHRLRLGLLLPEPEP